MSGKEDYRARLTHLVRGMLTGDGREIVRTLVAGSRSESIKMFIEGNQEKRFGKLQAHLEFMAQGIEGIERYVRSYILCQPLSPYATVFVDAERFLVWLERTVMLLPEQQDFVAYQRAQHRIAAKARHNRRDYVQFDKLSRRMDPLNIGFALDDEDSWIHLNPMHVWTRFHTDVLLDGEAVPPVDVLCYAALEELRTTMLDSFGTQLVRELSMYGPCTLSQWSALSRAAGRDEIFEFCTSLAELRLIAVDGA
ncbi:MAG: hypothetical protein MI923_30470 [Phycisphaerales bacterium]|nr:hypothetical protein [Phycisphaerales bacterium]